MISYIPTFNPISILLLCFQVLKDSVSVLSPSKRRRAGLFIPPSNQMSPLLCSLHQDVGIISSILTHEGQKQVRLR